MLGHTAEYADRRAGLPREQPLKDQHSLTTDPTVLQLRAAAELLGDDIWIAVKLPGACDGDDDLDDDAAIRPVDHRGAQ